MKLNLISLFEDTQYFVDTAINTEAIRLAYIPYERAAEQSVMAFLEQFNNGTNDTEMKVHVAPIDKNVNSMLKNLVGTHRDCIILKIPSYVVRGAIKGQGIHDQPAELGSIARPEVENTSSPDDEDNVKIVKGTRRFGFSFGKRDVMTAGNALGIGGTIGGKGNRAFGFNLNGMKKVFGEDPSKEKEDKGFDKWVDNEFAPRKGTPATVERTKPKPATEESGKKETLSQSSKIRNYITEKLKPILANVDLNAVMVYSFTSNMWYSMSKPNDHRYDVYKCPVDMERHGPPIDEYFS